MGEGEKKGKNIFGVVVVCGYYFGYFVYFNFLKLYNNFRCNFINEEIGLDKLRFSFIFWFYCFILFLKMI